MGNGPLYPLTRSRTLTIESLQAQQPSRLRQLATPSAWLLTAFIVFATWSPQSMRPHLARASLERFGAFFLLAAAFTAAYPKRPRAVGAIAIAFAIVLEFGQFVAFQRDPGVKDVIEKSLGAVCGVAAAAAITARERRNRGS